MKETVLVTGGAGYIGSHTCIELVSKYDVVIVDDLSNSSQVAIERIQELTNSKVTFYKLNLLNHDELVTVLKSHNVSAVIHFAGFKAVGESMKVPLNYYENNITGTLSLLRAMNAANCKRIVFSSSATVYGDPVVLPLSENMTATPTSPYGKTKLFIEEILKDLCTSDKTWNAVILRYFNPAGAHPSGKMGENPKGIPNNLMPYLAQVAIGKLPSLNVFGNDYDTPDGTGLRDYIHVVDLAKGHSNCGYKVYNLGTGKGYTVLQMIAAFSKVVGKQLPYQIAPRRGGDVSVLVADPTLANKELGWKAEKGLDEMCEDLWRWQTNFPNGFEG